MSEYGLPVCLKLNMQAELQKEIVIVVFTYSGAY